MLHITGSKLYSYIMCPHRVWRDVWGPQEEKIKEVNPFVELLWNRGVAHEERVVADLGEMLDLKTVGDEAVLTRILEYNEDDCKATMVLKDGLVKLSLASKIE